MSGCSSRIRCASTRISRVVAIARRSAVEPDSDLLAVGRPDRWIDRQYFDGCPRRPQVLLDRAGFAENHVALDTAAQARDQPGEGELASRELRAVIDEQHPEWMLFVMGCPNRRAARRRTLRARSDQSGTVPGCGSAVASSAAFTSVTNCSRGTAWIGSSRPRKPATSTATVGRPTAAHSYALIGSRLSVNERHDVRHDHHVGVLEVSRDVGVVAASEQVDTRKAAQARVGCVAERIGPDEHHVELGKRGRELDDQVEVEPILVEGADVDRNRTGRQVRRARPWSTEVLRVDRVRNQRGDRHGRVAGSRRAPVSTRRPRRPRRAVCARCARRGGERVAAAMTRASRR